MKYINKLTDKDIINITSIISNNNLVDILCVDKLSNELQIIYTIKKINNNRRTNIDFI